MADEKKKKETIKVMVPTARMINGSLYERDVFKDKDGREGHPSYKIEVVIPKNHPDTEAFMERIAEEVCAEFDQDLKFDFEGGDAVTPFIDGDAYAAEREKRGKVGDAYKGNWIIRAHTKYNHEGQDGPGGAELYDEDVNKVEPLQAKTAGTFYNGCFVNLQVSLNFYEAQLGRNKVPAVSFYMAGVQKDHDGERLTTGSSNAGAFKKIGRAANANTAEGGRRRRAG